MMKLLAATACALSAAPAVLAQTPSQAPAAEPPRAQGTASNSTVTDSRRSETRVNADVSEVVVSATRREVQLQRLPDAVTAITSKRLEELNAQTFQDYFRTIPGLMYNALGPGLNRFDFSIRGVSNFSQLIPVENATVGQYLDDIPVTAVGQQVDPRLVDIERIEILRGPQGTYFGEDALSGTIRIITKQPNLNDFSVIAESRLSWTQGGGANEQVSAVVNAPIIEGKLALRGNAFFANDSGFIDGVKGGCQSTGCAVDSVKQRDLNPGRDYGLRGLLLWQPMDRFSLLAEATHGRSRADNAAIYEPRVGDLRIIAESTSPGPGGSGQTGDPLGGGTGTNGGGDPQGGGSTSGQSTQGGGTVVGGDLNDGGSPMTLRGGDVANLRTTDVYSLYSLTGKLTFTGADVVSTSSLGQRDIVTGDPTTAAKGDTGTTIRDFAQELRLQSTKAEEERWDYILGLYFQRHKKNSKQAASGASGFIADRSTTKAIFGDVGRKFGPVAIRAGLRQQWIDIDRSFKAPSAPDPAGAATDNRATTGRLVLSYDVTSSAMIYGSVSRGFRRGGVNPSFAGVPSTYKPDHTNDFEIGWKVTGPRGLFLNGDVFIIVWDDIQVAQLATGAIGQQQYYANGGQARIDGVEVEGGFNLFEGLSTRFSLAYLDPRLTEDQPGSTCDRGCPGRKGDAIPYVSRETAGVSFHYTRRLGRGTWETFADLTEQFSGPRNTDFSPTAPNGSPNTVFRRVPSSWLTNLQIGLANPDWRVSLYVDNLLDRRNVYSIAPTFGVSGGNGDQYLIDRPRTVGVWLRRAF